MAALASGDNGLVTPGGGTDFEGLREQEWLCTNGLGGYASGTVAGANTRRYHGLLMAALAPPGGRTLLVANLEETLWFGAAAFELATNEYQDGTIHPEGYRYLNRFAIERGVPTWEYAFSGWRLQKKVWLEQGQNTTFVRYLLLEESSACRLGITPLLANRDLHAQQHGGGEFAWPYGEQWLACDQPSGFEASPCWYWRVRHRVERERGLDDEEDLFAPGTLRAAILAGRPLLLRLSAEQEPAPFAGAFDRAEAHAAKLLGPPKGPVPSTGLRVLGSHPAAVAQQQADVEARLRYAADQFIVETKGRAGGGKTVIAGYHWFADWGRDTMISLPGLLLGTGRYDEARDVLRMFAAHVDRGMLPNTFDEQGGATYNNVDATLWFFQAVDRYVRAADDPAFLREVLPVLEGIVDWHRKGTRFNIKVDPADGLLSAGQPGLQLTWMDAKAGDWVVTPRAGKPVEINALWFNAVCLSATWARDLQREAGDYQQLVGQVSRSFRSRFWNPQTNCLFDVIDGPHGDDASIRPNQLLAVSLPFATVFGPQAKAIVEVCREKLLTPYGLRTLAPEDPKYIGRYQGNQWSRDGCYHQGTVWPWLIGPFIDAYLKTHGDKEQASAFLLPLIRHMDEQAGLGTISEIFDGDEPHTPRGCIGQAWSVAEVLRCWHDLHAPPPERPSLHMGGGHPNGRH
ncbi:MAG: glycogen debranching enzyme family protein [Chloroflexi bacterium]|nr:glycogen debranching enzyme family protein [Chloroflexota bacterium]